MRTAQAFVLASMLATTGLLLGCGSSDNGSDDLSVADTGSSMDSTIRKDGPGADLTGVDLSGIDQGRDGAGPLDGAKGDAACANTTQSCGAPGQCVDCTNSTLGRACVSGACGCASSSDCPSGSACDPNSKQCGKSCANGLTCNGGCCDGQTCVAGADNAKCGSDGKACSSCGNGTPTCGMGICTPTCVPMGQVGGVCGNNFCCGANNQCQTIGPSSCGGGGGACVDCRQNVVGMGCVNGACGCAGKGDCPVGQACKNGICGAACDANTPCNGGCCDSVKNVCASGTANGECALGMSVCGTCVNNAKGNACVAINMMTTCGCNSKADCPVGEACLSNVCGTACDMNNPCNGGCCSAANNGVCKPGTDVAACGNNGGVCSACPNNANGHLCKPVGGGGQCGCNGTGDCNLNVACSNGLCDNSCDMAKPCANGCCSAAVNGTCQPGTTQIQCGIPSSLCLDCSSSLVGHVCRAPGVCGCETAADCPIGDACDATMHKCVASCNLNQPCNGGCCAGGMCAAGTAAGACSSMGNPTCLDCTQSPSGHLCLQQGNVVCGCNASADCPAFTACNVMTHQCEANCSQNQLCNGGCCATGKCTAGTANTACGVNGGACVGCADGTPTCQAGACTAKCGAVSDGVCNTGHCCKAGACVASSDASCGFSGTCADCGNNSNGSKCETNKMPYYCGCDDETQCFKANPLGGQPGQTCTTASHTCTSLCGVAGVTVCNGGCCSGAGGSCRVGTQDGQCGAQGGFCNNCSSTCSPGPHCGGNGTCGCTADNQCYGDGVCAMAPKNALGCNIAASSCCIPGILGFSDNGDAKNCCAATSTNGKCDCFVQGGVDNGNDFACCSLVADMNGKCVCTPSNQGPCFTNAGCCSNSCLNPGPNGVCACAAPGKSCQGNSGCCSLKCNAGSCL